MVRKQIARRRDLPAQHVIDALRWARPVLRASGDRKPDNPAAVKVCRSLRLAVRGVCAPGLRSLGLLAARPIPVRFDIMKETPSGSLSYGAGNGNRRRHTWAKSPSIGPKFGLSWARNSSSHCDPTSSQIITCPRLSGNPRAVAWHAFVGTNHRDEPRDLNGALSFRQEVS